MIGLFRRESTTSGSVAGSDPCLAIQLATDLVAASRTPCRGASDRRSISICGVTPIVETSENGSHPLGALIEMENTAQIQQENSNRRNSRRGSLLDMNG